MYYAFIQMFRVEIVLKKILPEYHETQRLWPSHPCHQQDFLISCFALQIRAVIYNIVIAIVSPYLHFYLPSIVTVLHVYALRVCLVSVQYGRSSISLTQPDPHTCLHLSMTSLVGIQEGVWVRLSDQPSIGRCTHLLSWQSYEALKVLPSLPL